MAHLSIAPCFASPKNLSHRPQASLNPRTGLPFDRQPGRQDAGHGHSGPDGDGRTRRLFRGGGEGWERERLDAGGSL